MKTAEQALDRIENKTSSATNYTRAEMIFFANYFADIHHKQQLLLHNVSNRRELLKLKDFVKEQQDLPSEINDIVNDNFWELL